MRETEHLLELNTLVSRFGSTDTRDRVLGRLHALVSRRGPFEDGGVGWLEDLGEWVCGRGRISARRPEEQEAHARLRVLADALEELPSFQQALSDVVQKLLASTSSTQLFTGAGLAAQSGFWGELIDRLVRRVLPEPPVSGRLGRVCARLFGHEALGRAWTSFDEAGRARLVAALGIGAHAFERGLGEASLLLATRLGAYGTSDEVLALVGQHDEVSGSPFLGLAEAVAAGEPAALVARLDACDALVALGRQGLEARGISVDLVFRLDLIEALLRRLRLLVAVAVAPGSSAVRELEAELIRGVASDRSLLAVWRTGTRLLARRVVERAGHSGEHYATRTRLEQRAMLAAAAGGGALTAFAVANKAFIAHTGLPPLFLALAIGLNYSLAFVLMQWLHLSLATKQPSMTAATIAGAVEASLGDEGTDLEPVVDLVARASRTQFAALIGNVVMVVPVCVAIDGVAWLATGSHLIDAGSAAQIVARHHPWHSGTFWFALATGVWLWAASLIAGAVENWFIVREFPGALTESRLLRRWLGPERAARMGAAVREQLSGLGGNVGLGMLLGFMPMLFSLFGVPLDVRHVTFVTGQLAFAALQLGPYAFAHPAMLVAVLAVPLVGLANFAASFSLALLVASRSRNLGTTWLARLAGAVGRRFVANPGSFFVAPRDLPAQIT